MYPPVHEIPAFCVLARTCRPPGARLVVSCYLLLLFRAFRATICCGRAFAGTGSGGCAQLSVCCDGRRRPSQWGDSRLLWMKRYYRNLGVTMLRAW
eukprot:4554227-Prymnesium_polylepis.2